MRMKTVQTFLSYIACLLLSSSLMAADKTEVHVYRMQYQLADALVSAVEDVLLPGESVNAFNNELVVNASAASHREVSALLDTLDKPSRNLLITVRNNSNGQGNSSSTGISGGIRTGEVYLGSGGPVYHERRDNGGLVVQHDGVRIHSNQGTRQSSSSQEQQLRTMEGHPAWISTGQSVPYRSVDRWGNPVTDYKDADRGFYVTAYVMGDRVQLQISTSNDRLSEDPRRQRRGIIETERLQTTVSGVVGEWINLGGITLQDQRRDSDYTRRSGETTETIGDIAVRIIPAD